MQHRIVESRQATLSDGEYISKSILTPSMSKEPTLRFGLKAKNRES